MSVVDYNSLLYKVGEEIDWQTKRKQLLFICKDFLPDGCENDITDFISLLTKLEEENLLGTDRLDVLKDLLKGIEKGDLLGRVEQFEFKRAEYKQLLEQISRVLDECNQLERLISMCRGKIARDKEKDIKDISTLLTELEKQNNLGVRHLNILKTMVTEMEKPDLFRLIEEFEKKRKQEEDVEERRRRRRAQRASVWACGISFGQRLIGIVTPHCTFRNVYGGIVVVTTWMVLRKSSNLAEFANAFTVAVLPLGNFLWAIRDGSLCFAVQAENISSLKALWERYQDGRLQRKLQEFLVTEEIKKLAGGEVMLTVHINEEEYRNATLDLMISEREEMKVGEKRGLKDRASSDSDLSRMREEVSGSGKDLGQVKEFMSVDRKVPVEEFMEKERNERKETYSMKTQTTDSGVATKSAPSEYESDKNQGDRQEKLHRLEVWITNAIENWNSFLIELRGGALSEDVLIGSARRVKKEMERVRKTFEALKKSEKNIMVPESLLSKSYSPEEVIQQLKNVPHVSLDEASLKNPNTDAKTFIRVLARKAKDLNRFDVFRHLRKITPAGTTGPLLSHDLNVRDIPSLQRRRLTIELGVAHEWMMLAGRLGLTSQEIRFLDRQTSNQMESVLSFIAHQRYVSVGELYDLLIEQELPEVADLL